MITRKLGRLLHGKTSPFQVYAACALGVMLGFQPSFTNAPGTVATLIAVLLVLNANFFLAGLAALLGKLLLVGLLPAAFHVGRLMLDGPTQPIFEAAINAPVLALFGLEYYATTGGLVLGLLLGLFLGFLVMRLIKSLRRKLAAMEQDSQRYARWSQKKWVKAATWLFFGGKGKKTYAELAGESRMGNPVRPLGAVAVVLLAVLVGLVYVFLSDTLVTAFTIRGLERANGATVDLERAEVDLGGGRLTLHNLAMADPNALDRDLFRATTLEADISAADLLRKRLALDNVQITDGSTGMARASRGWIVGKPPTPIEPQPPAGDEKTLEDYVAQARQWRERLAQVREWLDRGSGPAEPQDKPTFDDWVKQQVAQLGYANIKADHLLRGAPTFLVRRLAAEGVVSSQLDGEKLDIEATHLSTHPALVGEAPTIRIRSAQDTLKLDLALPVAAEGREAGVIDFALNGLAVDAVAGDLEIDGGQPVRGGTYDLELTGDFSPAELNLPLRLTLHDTTLTIPGSSPQAVSRLPLTLGLRGALDSPRLLIDHQQLTDALVAAGATELANRARGELDRAVNEARENVRQEIGDQLGEQLGGGLKDLLNRRQRQEREQDE